MTDLSYLYWLDYAGAPPIMLPKSLAQYWRGFYIPLPPGDEDDADIDLIIGEDQFLIHDEFDFEHPVTDYDRLCRRCQEHEGHALLLPLPKGEALGFATSFDNIAWWPEQQMLVSGGRTIDEQYLPSLPWEFSTEWTLKEKKVLLMNSCDHGAAPTEQKDKLQIIDMAPGQYIVEASLYSDEEPSLLYRFLKK